MRIVLTFALKLNSVVLIVQWHLFRQIIPMLYRSEMATEFFPETRMKHLGVNNKNWMTAKGLQDQKRCSSDPPFQVSIALENY